MNAKLFFTLLIAINCYTSCGAALRRKPKVYNALITTDENLTSSRAYPVIQPTIHEPGVAHFPFGPFSPFGFYSPPVVRYGQPLAPGLTPREQLPYHLPEDTLQYPFEVVSQPQNLQPFPNYEVPPNARQPPSASYPPSFPGQQQKEPSDKKLSEAFPHRPQQPARPALGAEPQNRPSYLMPLPQEIKPYSGEQSEHQQPEQHQPEPQPQPQLQPQQPQTMPKEKLPIPLNEFGFPPALIPFQQYPNNQEPLPAPSYGYPHYPVVYDPITGYPEQFLPHFDYYPSHNFVFGPSPGTERRATPSITTSSGLPYVTAAGPGKETATKPNFMTELTSAATQNSRNDEEKPTTPESAAAGPTQANDVTTPDLERIKNVSKNKNQSIPDVPPPPIPSGAKLKKQ